MGDSFMARNYNSQNINDLEDFINHVAEEILNNNLSLFIGAGSSMQYDAMNWQELVDSVYKGRKDWSNLDKAQYAELRGINIKSEICNKMKSLIIDEMKTDTYLYHLLDFDYKSIWTTNYDSVIESILKTKSKNYLSIYKYNHFKNLSFPGQNFLYKINGSSDSPESIMITKEDFIDYRRSHEAYLILLKRELLCQSFLFLGCSFNDDILRMCIKDILNCIDNSRENYSTNHYAIIVDRNTDMLDFISKDLQNHYNINCLIVNEPKLAYKIAYGIACKVKYTSIFVSGARAFMRHSSAENQGKLVCREIIEAFKKQKTLPFKFICGMGMSIGNFICGSIKSVYKNFNINRYLQMEPFPFLSPQSNENHRKRIMSKAGIFLFLYGDFDGDERSIFKSGIWKEYQEAKQSSDNIIVPLPCGKDSISQYIFSIELNDPKSFTFKNQTIFQKFNYQASNEEFFNELVAKIILASRISMDEALNRILKGLTD